MTSRKATTAERMARELDEQLERALLGNMTSTVPDREESVLTPEKLDVLARDWEDKVIRALRRSQITIIVDLAHQGPVLRYVTPNDGTVYEMNHRAAQEVHQEWPLRLHQVLSEERAEFVPAGMFDTFVPKVLPPPPYDLPEEPAPVRYD